MLQLLIGIIIGSSLISFIIAIISLFSKDGILRTCNDKKTTKSSHRKQRGRTAPNRALSKKNIKFKNKNKKGN